MSGAAHLRAPASSSHKLCRRSTVFARCIRIFSRAPSADSAPPQMVFDNRCSEKRLELSIDNTVASFNPSEIVETQPLIHVGALPPERTELRLLDYLASASH